ncbi:hypothetical protein [Microbacter margulisiae]|uniref:Seryl-tRNA synthetase n=1 Tax=Microbacter margulisiae TaxID=1350067 RepID=A0A7W5H2H1_9PORP|nr:hypothetical protein [Microbacter margulisiae]MBB3187416.1 seryl-tRNA synthetase [Microbacter margulisiae]
MNDIEIQKAIQEIMKLQQANNNLTVEIGHLSAKDENKNTIAGHIEELTNNKTRMETIRKSVGLFYAVWECNWNGQTLMPENVVSPQFDTRIDADSYLINNLKSKKIKGKKEFAVFQTTLNADGKYVGHY